MVLDHIIRDWMSRKRDYLKTWVGSSTGMMRIFRKFHDVDFRGFSSRFFRTPGYVSNDLGHYSFTDLWGSPSFDPCVL